MDYTTSLSIPKGLAVCYSGFRDGQRPGDVYPSYEQVKEDLEIIKNHWNYIRLYSCDQHALTVLEVIRNEQLPLGVMLGAYLDGEASNPNCPWGGDFSDEQISINKKKNSEEVETLILWANQYKDIVIALAVGNESCVDWSGNMVPVENMIAHVRKAKAETEQPITFCENYVPWLTKLAPLVEELDFISIHTYPLWENKTIEASLAHTQENYRQVSEKYPDKVVVITEAGWATDANGRGFPKSHANVVFQKMYYDALCQWTTENTILTFVFEAFDEPWKGSQDPCEPEKHWGLYYEDRNPKMALADSPGYKR
jgi:exo-beta-1,3-glucanase (GH17 family)